MTIAPSSVFLPTLPGRYYTDPAIFEREKRNIFERQWQYVCRAEDVPSPGRFVRVMVGNENVIVVRGRDGELRAFLNVCRHRGSTLCLTDRGDVGRSIRCPYHAWTYRLDGSLMSAPNWRSMAAADKADFGLHPVHLGEWHGMVWLNLADDPAPLDDLVCPQLDYRLGGDRARFARYDLAGLSWGGGSTTRSRRTGRSSRRTSRSATTAAPSTPNWWTRCRPFRTLALATYDTEGYVFALDKVSFSASGTALLPRLPGLEDRDDRKYYGMVLRPELLPVAAA